jgi:hypothetical protein
MWLELIAAVEYLEAAPTFASNHRLGVVDLTNRLAAADVISS